jgi:hypothetical protein
MRTSRRPLSCVLVVVARIIEPPTFVGAGVAEVAGDVAAAVGCGALSSPPQAALAGSRTVTRASRRGAYRLVMLALA